MKSGKTKYIMYRDGRNDSIISKGHLIGIVLVLGRQLGRKGRLSSVILYRMYQGRKEQQQ